MRATAVATLRRNREDLEAIDRAHLFHPSTHLKAHAEGRSAATTAPG